MMFDGGPGSGPHPGSAAEHFAKAKDHAEKAKFAEQAGYKGAAADHHANAMKEIHAGVEKGAEKGSGLGRVSPEARSHLEKAAFSKSAGYNGAAASHKENAVKSIATHLGVKS